MVGGRSVESLDVRITSLVESLSVCARREIGLSVGHRVISGKKSDLLFRQSSVGISPQRPAVSRRRVRTHLE